MLTRNEKGEQSYSQELFDSAISIANLLNSYEWYLARRKQVQQLVPPDLPGDRMLGCRDGRHCYR
jgi:hypothetical protein